MTTQFFLKFGQPSHIKNLLDNGHVYINHANIFKKPDFDFGRFDLNEGRNSIEHYTNMTFEFQPEGESKWKKLFSPHGKFEKWYDISKLHFYCLYNISIETTKQHEYYELGDDIKKMGESYLLVHKPQLFIDRLKTELKKLDYEFASGYVSYYNPDIDNTQLGLFSKTNEYTYQNEYRFVIKNNDVQPINIYLGNLSDIAEMVETSKHKGFRFIWP